MAALTPLSQAGAMHGGKAQGLRALIELGLDVPDGVALSQDATAALAVADPEVVAELRQWLGTTSQAIAVRSSALNEDGAVQSFAGIYESMLNISSDSASVAEAVREVSGSGALDRVESYSGARSDSIPVILQRMVKPIASGVMFTRAVDAWGGDCVYVEWVHGLGDALMAGRVTPSSVRMGWDAGAQAGLAGNSISCEGRVPDATWIDALSRLVEVIDRAHASRSMDVEWTVDQSGKLWALQVRPVTRAVTVPGRRQTGGALPASAGVGEGPVRQIDDESIDELQAGDVLVTRITETSYIPAMKLAAAIVTEEGGLLSHAAIVARELGKPCVVGVAGATSLLRESEPAYVDGSKAIVRQGDLVFGSGQEIDWASVYLYDRGYEISAAGVPIYVEPTLNGVTAFVDFETGPEVIQQVDLDLRRSLRVDATIIEGDRRIWYNEWRRFNRLESVALASGLFRSAIAAWSVERLNQAIALLDWAALRIGGARDQVSVERMFWRETGAALHALVAVIVEGEALWAIYRESAAWRKMQDVSFPAFLRREFDVQDLTPKLRVIFPMMQRLGELRNHAYPHFSSSGAYSSAYFGERFSLLAGIPGIVTDDEDEDAALERLYGDKLFIALDRRFAARLARRYFKASNA